MTSQRDQDLKGKRALQTTSFLTKIKRSWSLLIRSIERQICDMSIVPSSGLPFCRSKDYNTHSACTGFCYLSKEKKGNLVLKYIQQDLYWLNLGAQHIHQLDFDQMLNRTS